MSKTIMTQKQYRNYNLLVWLSLTLIIFLSIGYISAVNGQVNVEGLRSIHEDETIICVNKSDQIDNNGFICHIYNTENIDWYDEYQQKQFYNESDSFDINIVD